MEANSHASHQNITHSMKLFAIVTVALLAAPLLSAADRPLHAMDTCTKVSYPGSAVHSPEEQLDWLQKYGYAGIAWTEE
jgi:hypothetical protein